VDHDRLKRFLSRTDNPLVRSIGRVPATVNRKLLVAFVGIVVLLVIIGLLGLRVLGDANDRVDALGKLQQRTAAYQEFQTDATELRLLLGLRAGGSDIYVFNGSNPTTQPGNVAAIDSTVQSTLSRLVLLTDARNLGFAPPSEDMSALAQIKHDSTALATAMSHVVRLDLAGQPSQGAQIQHQEGEPRANDLQLRTAQLVSTAKRETNDLIALNTGAFSDSQHLFIGIAAGSIVLALLLGFAISGSLTGPIRKMDTRLAGIASGDFSGHVDVANRDELGALAANVNRMNDRLAHLYRELETASKHKSEFLANMSHELRTPLNAVIGFSEVLQDRLFGDLNEKQAEYVGDIHTSGRHLLALINDILDLSKIEAGKMELQVTTFALSDVLENAVALARERATRQGISLRLEVDPSAGAIAADERKIKQVLFNLLTNALKFTARSGHVDVTARGDGDEVHVSVSDDGIGIAAADHARIFEEFQQVGQSQLQEGTGLGLAVSRRFVELHGGRLWVESEPEQGSTFTFTVPRTQSAGADADGSLHPEAAGVASTNTPLQS
jgi:signal transduction histidine kinase